MLEPAFTPGPWGVETFQNGMQYIGPMRPSGTLGDIVCDVDNGPEYTAEAQARNKANARLIAAAPALYEAVEWICRLAAMPDGALDEDWNAAIDNGMIALSLALGEGQGGRNGRRDEEGKD